MEVGACISPPMHSPSLDPFTFVENIVGNF
jgi:hypothetical protein